MRANTPGSFAPGKEDTPPPLVDWLLINADWLVTGAEETPVISSAGLAIRDDTLVGVGPSDWIEASFAGRQIMDMRGHLLLPGLINTHTHGAMSCFRGLGDDLPLQQWLFDVIFPAESASVTPEMVYWGTLLSALEMLKNGVTTFCDGYFFEEAAARAALDSGMRAVLGQGILDFPSPDQPDPSRFLECAEAFLESFPRDVGRLRPSLFCHAPYTCGPNTLQRVKALCRERGILFQIHLSETASEVQELVEKHGERPAFYLDRLGLLDSMTLCVHGVWLDQSEMDLLALRQTSLSHTVESNAKLASGVAPVPQILAAGIHVGLGTDSCASNNDLDLFSEMDKVAKLHKVFLRDPLVCAAPQVLRMATQGAAATIGWANMIGTLQVGKNADLTAIDLNQPHLTPLYDPISHLVYAVRGSDVRHVWVDGRQVVRDGQVLTVDEDSVISEVRRIARQVIRARNSSHA